MIPILLGCSTPFTPPTVQEDMIFFDEGTFDMGVPDIEPGPYGNYWKETAQPQHEVTLSPFWLDKTEVRVADYVLFLQSIEDDLVTRGFVHHHPLQPITYKDGVFSALPEKENTPMNYVSFYDALTFCGWRGASLPTEAQWERAAKGGDRDQPRSFPWSEGGGTCQKAIYYTNNTLCAYSPQDVGIREQGATPEGVYDLGGNVSEWVWDWYARYAPEAQIDPKGPDLGRYKILRGGGFRETADAMRTTDRVMANPLSRSEGIGFRCARTEDL